MTKQPRKHEGRSQAERTGQRLIDTQAAEKRKQKKAEEEEWASKSGPVTSRRVERDD